MGLAGLGLLGCDPADGDQAARKQLNDAYALRSAEDPQQQYVGLAETAAGSQSSEATLAQAKELVGDVSLELASATIAGPIIEKNQEAQDVTVPGLAGLETRAIVLAEQAHRLANALALGSTYIASEQRKDPAQVLGAVDARIGTIRQGQAWTPSEESGVTLETLETTQQRAQQLNEQLEQLNSQIARLEQQRSETLALASQLDQQSDQELRDQSVATYRQVADLRTEAAQVSVGIERLNAQVRQATAELQQAQAYQGALEETVDALQSQQEALRQNWDGVQTQIGELEKANQATFTGGDAGGASVESLAQELAGTLTRINELRASAAGNLDKATSAYRDAAGLAQTASGSGAPMFGTAYQEAFNASRIRLGNAVALRQLGQLHAGSARVHAAILRLQQTLQESGRELPTSLLEAVGAPIEQAYTDSVAQAASALTEADGLLTELSSSGARGPLGPSSITQRAVVLTSLASLNELIETTGVQVSAELPSAQTLLEQAKLVSEAAQASDAQLPAAAPFFGGAGRAPATQPATQPTTDPATEPAAEPATEPAGEEGAAGEGGEDAAGGQSPPENR
jgi:hypothetical protein